MTIKPHNLQSLSLQVEGTHLPLSNAIEEWDWMYKEGYSIYCILRVIRARALSTVQDLTTQSDSLSLDLDIDVALTL